MTRTTYMRDDPIQTDQVMSPDERNLELIMLNEIKEELS